MPDAHFSALKKRKFLAAFAETGNCLEAERMTGIPARTHRDWVKRSEPYRRDFAVAQEQAIQVLEREARRRAFEGVEDTVWYNGKAVGTTRKYSDVLLIFLLKAQRPEMYRERLDARFTSKVETATSVTVVHEYHDGPTALPSERVHGLPAATDDDSSLELPQST